MEGEPKATIQPQRKDFILQHCEPVEEVKGKETNCASTRVFGNSNDRENHNGPGLVFIPTYLNMVFLQLLIHHPQIFADLHTPSQGHAGITQAIANLSAKYLIPNLREKVVLVLAHTHAHILRYPTYSHTYYNIQARKLCTICDQYMRPNKVAPIPILTKRALQLIMFDLSKIEGMVDAAGKPFHMLIVMDHYSKYLWSDIVRGKDPEPIADFLKKTFKREGTPERWHADNGGEFRNEVMNMVRRELSKHDPNNDMLPFSRSTPRHPECQGLVEKQNDTMKRKIYKGVVDEFNQYVIRFVWKFKTYVRIQVPGYDHTHYRLTD